MLETRIKRYLNDMIEIAFSDYTLPMRKQMKSYFLKVETKENKTSSGMYHTDTRTIEVYNASLGESHLLKCCLHELSHHIDLSLNGTTGHQKPFYEVYTKLIYAALDMRLLSKEDFHDPWSRDNNKVRNIINKYQPKEVDYTPPAFTVVRVYGAYNYKERLKSLGFYWNRIEQIWEIENPKDMDATLQSLKDLGFSEKAEGIKTYYEIVSVGLRMNPLVYLKADGKTYENREELKKLGFYFLKNERLWVVKVHANEAKVKIREYNEILRPHKIIISVLDRRS